MGCRQAALGAAARSTSSSCWSRSVHCAVGTGYARLQLHCASKDVVQVSQQSSSKHYIALLQKCNVAMQHGHDLGPAALQGCPALAKQLYTLMCHHLGGLTFSW